MMKIIAKHLLVLMILITVVLSSTERIYLNETDPVKLSNNNTREKSEPWYSHYDVLIKNFAEQAKKDHKTVLGNYIIPPLSHWIKPEAKPFDRSSQKVTSTGYEGHIFTLLNYPDQYVEKYTSKSPPEMVSKENKMGIYASYWNPNLFVKHFGIYGPHGRSLLLEKCVMDLREFLNNIFRESKFNMEQFLGLPNDESQEQIRRAMWRDILYKLSTFLPALLSELNTLKIVHGDIKPENILISMINGNISYKLGDFGHAQFVTERDVLLYGTRSFRSPLLQWGCWDEKRDVYAAGKTILDVLRYIPNKLRLDLDFPTPRDTKDEDSKLYKIIAKLVEGIDKKILTPDDEKLRERLKELLFQYLVKWRDGCHGKF